MWFRQDLRLRDNPALNHASTFGKVLPLFIYDQSAPQRFQPGGASKWWLHQSLTSLNDKLDGQLHCLSGDASEELLRVVEQSGIKRVVWNRCYEPWQIQRDSQIKKQLRAIGVEVHSFNGSLLWEPWSVLKKDNTPYRVFTPYYRKGCLVAPAPRTPTGQVGDLKWDYQEKCDDGIKSLNLMPEINWFQDMQQLWSPGEDGAAQKLSQFLNHALGAYKEQRDIPSVKGTSCLSPHLHWGEISPNQIWYASIDAKQGEVDNKHLDCYLSELGWREFSYYLLYHFPHIPTENFSAKFGHFPWRKDPTALTAWQKGQTGIPIIDAGMRELWKTGYMHNRVRMIVGSFLVKNLLIHWHEGERWFWDCLVDADLAANAASWQWVSGTGADAAPYFRIFNPVLQGKKFDTQGKYVKTYCPELSQLPDSYIHCPWLAPEDILEHCGVKLGVNYPQPIVDLAASRHRALDALSASKELANS